MLEGLHEAVVTHLAHIDVLQLKGKQAWRKGGGSLLLVAPMPLFLFYPSRPKLSYCNS